MSDVIYRINRIRLEFKEDLEMGKDIKVLRINRIRLEFKAGRRKCDPDGLAPVLIESDWNLKLSPTARYQRLKIVLIESDWNLKILSEDYIKNVLLY